MIRALRLTPAIWVSSLRMLSRRYPLCPMMESLPTLLLATAYAPPVSYFVKLYEHVAGTIALEGCEHYIKQSYRNRCRILGPNGVQSLTIPVELPAGTKTPIREVRISDHGEWRHLHAQALRTAYGASPFFEFYADELMPFYERRYTYLWDFNAELCRRSSLSYSLTLTGVRLWTSCPLSRLSYVRVLATFAIR